MVVEHGMRAKRPRYSTRRSTKSEITSLVCDDNRYLPMGRYVGKLGTQRPKSNNTCTVKGLDWEVFVA